MKPIVLKAAAVVLSMVMVFSMLSACGSAEVEEAAADVQIDTAAEIAAPFVIFEADGLQITVEDTAGMSVQQLL